MRAVTALQTPAQTISPREAHRSVTSLVLIDVRTPAEFEEAHIEGSVLHPLSDLDPMLVGRLAQGKHACVLVCRTGTRAQQAADNLHIAAGLPPVRILDGGVLAWESASLPLRRGRKTMSLERQVRILAGAMVFTGAALGSFVHPAWIALPAFVGAGLVFAGLTNSCGLGLVLARMPWNHRRPTVRSAARRVS